MSDLQSAGKSNPGTNSTKSSQNSSSSSQDIPENKFNERNLIVTTRNGSEVLSISFELGLAFNYALTNLIKIDLVLLVKYNMETNELKCSLLPSTNGNGQSFKITRSFNADFLKGSNTYSSPYPISGSCFARCS